MSDFAFPPPHPPSVPIAGSTSCFPVRRIFCVGRNYAEHALEMGNDPVKDPPFFFGKPADTIVEDGATLDFPCATEDLHHEVELVIAIGTGGADIPVSDAPDHIWGYAVGNDLTRRDLQTDAKAGRRPWDMSKGFDNSAIVGAIHPVERIGHLTKAAITAHVNDTLRQNGDIGDMIWPVADIIAFLSRLVMLAPGDLIYTGTPAGVGHIRRGDTCTVAIAGLGKVTTRFI